MEKPHLYGTADEADRDPPAAQGMRGENRPDEAAGYAHDLTLGDGRTVTVEQASGVAFAEATGAAGRRAPEAPEIEFAPDATPDWVWPATFFGLIAFAGILYFADRRRRSGEQVERFDERTIATGGDVGGGLRNSDVGHQSGVGLGTGGEIADQGQIDFQSAR